jgi:ATP-dependent Clp protease protease subunit
MTLPPPPFPPPPNLPEFLQASMFARRIVTVTGPLDTAVAGDVAATLMTLDALGDDHVTLRLDCADATLEGAFTVMDTIDLLGVPVHVICVGMASGPAVGVLAVGARRMMTPHARIQLCEPTVQMTGRASDLESWSSHYQSQLERLQHRLAEATGQPFEHVEADMQRRRYLDADEALAYGLVDEIATPRTTGRAER